MDDLAKNVSGWLYQILSSDRLSVTAKEAEYVVQAKDWLAKVNQGQLIVTENIVIDGADLELPQ